MPPRKSHPLLLTLNNSFIDLPSPSNISYWWNFGSTLGICLIVQLLTGIFLAMHFCANATMAFDSVSHIMRDVNFGPLMRIIHANGASFFFICVYLHTGRNIYYNSFTFSHTWFSGIAILFALMATAFVGYVLPWGQMSFWGATVITNLLSAIPYLGGTLVQWIWGGFSVDNATLSRFFTFHFLLPFILVALILVHLVNLHITGSNNPLGIKSSLDKIPFHPYFVFKDLLGFLLMFIALIWISLTTPFILGDPENFNPANPLVTPIHIQPEWYFLFAYAILRSIPNKLGGVMALLASILILAILPLSSKSTLRGSQFYPLSKAFFWGFLNIALILTWIGARPVEAPYELVGQIFTVLYFSYFLINPLALSAWKN